MKYFPSQLMERTHKIFLIDKKPYNLIIENKNLLENKMTDCSNSIP